MTEPYVYCSSCGVFHAGVAHPPVPSSSVPEGQTREEVEMRAMLDKARERVRPTIESRGQIVGTPGNWIAPQHTCKCGGSVNWREQGLFIVGTCGAGQCDSYFSYQLSEGQTAPSREPSEREALRMLLAETVCLRDQSAARGWPSSPGGSVDRAIRNARDVLAHSPDSVVPPSERQAPTDTSVILRAWQAYLEGADDVTRFDAFRAGYRAAALLRSPNPPQVLPADPAAAAVLKEFGWYDAEQNARDVAGKLAQEVIRLRSPIAEEEGADGYRGDEEGGDNYSPTGSPIAFDQKAFDEALQEVVDRCIFHRDADIKSEPIAAAYRDLLAVVRGYEWRPFDAD